MVCLLFGSLHKQLDKYKFTRVCLVEDAVLYRVLCYHSHLSVGVSLEVFAHHILLFVHAVAGAFGFLVCEELQWIDTLWYC